MNHRNQFLRRRALAATLTLGAAVAAPPILIPTSAVAGPKATSAKVATIPVAGMTCGRCAANITAALDALDGVQKSSVDAERGQAVVHFDATRVKIKRIIAAIESVGYEPGKPVVKGA